MTSNRKCLYILKPSDSTEVFPSSYGLISMEQFCYKVQKSILAKKGVITEIVTRDQQMATSTRKLIGLKLVGYTKERLEENEESEFYYGGRLPTVKHDANGNGKDH